MHAKEQYLIQLFRVLKQWLIWLIGTKHTFASVGALTWWMGCLDKNKRRTLSLTLWLMFCKFNVLSYLSPRNCLLIPKNILKKRKEKEKKLLQASHIRITRLSDTYEDPFLTEDKNQREEDLGWAKQLLSANILFDFMWYLICKTKVFSIRSAQTQTLVPVCYQGEEQGMISPYPEDGPFLIKSGPQLHRLLPFGDHSKQLVYMVKRNPSCRRQRLAAS